MKMIIAIFAVILLVVTAFIVYVPTQEASEETSFGAWCAGIDVTYENGDTETLSINPIISGELLSGDKVITGITYRLKAKATGAGYTGCEVDLRNTLVTPILTENGALKWTGESRCGLIRTLDLDDVSHTVLQISIDSSDIESSITSLNDGVLTFQHSGTVRFRGLPDGEWADANLPTDPTLSLSLGGAYTVTIHTNPTGCYVEFENHGYKTSDSSGNAVFTGVTAGTYHIVVAKSGYNRQQGSRTVNSDEHWTYTMVPSGPAKYTVTIKTNPSGGRASIDDVWKDCETSGAVFTGITAGSHYVVVIKSGYNRQQGYRTVDSNEVWTYNMVPSSPTTYTVTIHTNPSGCSVNFENHGTKTSDSSGNAVFTGVTAGTYHIVVTKSGYNRQQGTRTVNSDEHWTYTLSGGGGQMLSLTKLSFSYELRNEPIIPYYTSPDKYLGNPR